ncbi:helix-turn-helix transcriptional regulator [Priestia aryabhattai]|uniref:helix-turn-helix domain-containing protein n=1 Tax=Priestia aryabhattai TaxID=412384 RepID=UPI002880F204|nr:helix-turn-helix transcriptional regulator [Priestia aryabhattai]MDT0150028.1 helix-turn-helix transcriptional regulator [Priestia aryabhattai]MDT0155598.1 helix-turn-helix transcriptional regulator [Priestia aryabhattai]
MILNLDTMTNSEVILDMVHKYPQKVRIKLSEVLDQRGLTQGDLHLMTGIRAATLSEIANGKKQSFYFVHLVAIMCALRITDIREIIDVEFEEDVKEAWKEEMTGYEKGLTGEQQREVEANATKLALASVKRKK